MIYRLVVRDVEKGALPGWRKAPFLRQLDKLEFTAGVNLIYGPNGSGKSTIINTLASLLCAKQGGHQVVTDSALSDLGVEHSFKGNTISATVWNDGVVLEQDGGPAVYTSPDHVAGMQWGMAAIDYDFTDECLSALTSKGSSGQLQSHRLLPSIAHLKNKDWPKLVVKTQRPIPESLWSLLNGDKKSDVPTILLDEPTRSFDIRSELYFWRVVAKYQDAAQMIIATHSVVPLMTTNKTFNIIETEQEYFEKCRLHLGLLQEGTT